MTVVRIPDSTFLLAVLSDGIEHELSEIIDRSKAERGHGLTVHSRAADLRAHGHLVEQRSERAANGRTLSYYRLVSRVEQQTLSSSPEDPRCCSTGEMQPSLFQIPASARGAYSEAA